MDSSDTKLSENLHALYQFARSNDLHVRPSPRHHDELFIHSTPTDKSTTINGVEQLLQIISFSIFVRLKNNQYQVTITKHGGDETSESYSTIQDTQYALIKHWTRIKLEHENEVV